LLFGVGPYDPVTIAGVCVILALTAWISAYMPALRASRVDPMLALRGD
jgi:ABC-type lipoprotein release transport system permease subunit